VFFDKPSREMVDALDRLFAAGENTALAQALSLDVPGNGAGADGERP
jgi:exodeoxyribonuclease V beta subunit